MMTVQEWIEAYIDLLRPELAPRTIEQYADLARRYILPAVGKMPLDALRPLAVAQLLAPVSAVHPRTAQLVHRLLSAACKRAVAYGLLPVSPMEAIAAPRHRRAAPRWLDAETARALLTRTVGSRWHIAWSLALCLGLRRGELAGLRWGDVDLDRRQLVVAQQIQLIDGHLVSCPPKSEAGKRQLPLPPSLAAELAMWRRTQRAPIGPDCYVLSCHADGGPVTPAAIGHALKRDMEKAGLAPINLHGLRHTMATMAVAQGVHLRVLQALLGHSSISITADTYSHILPSTLQTALETIDQALV